MIISPLTKVTIISPNKSVRKSKIDTITIHCMACNGSLTAIGNAFAKKSTGASSNYGVDSKGMVGCYAPEEYRSWCSSNSKNDDRAITIEVANDGGANTGWHVSNAALEGLIQLLVDICQRNNIKELKWKANKALIGQVELQNMTVHRWFANKACPGDYLYNLHGSIAAEVNKRLGVTPAPQPTPTPQPSMKAAVPVVKKGTKGANAKLLQQNLNTFGCGLVEDGIFGKASVAALKAWQKSYKLAADGIYGNKSYAKMKALIEK